MSAIDRMKESIIYAMMQKNGWTEESKQTNPLDWDPERDDSQISMIKEDVNFILDSFLEHLETESDDEEELEEEDESIFDEYGHLRRKQTNTTSASIFVFMDAGTGVPRYVSDVREWLARVDRLGVPNDTEIEGSLYLSFDIDEPYTERIECGGCGTKDILLTVHSCEETPC
jgi:hypothetical protein